MKRLGPDFGLDAADFLPSRARGPFDPPDDFGPPDDFDPPDDFGPPADFDLLEDFDAPADLKPFGPRDEGCDFDLLLPAANFRRERGFDGAESLSSVSTRRSTLGSWQSSSLGGVCTVRL